MTFIAENWIALLSLLVAAIGGVPGIVSILQHRRRRPTMTATLANTIIGTTRFTSDGPEYTHVILALTLANAGEAPLTPGVFDLEVRHADRWLRFERRLIPEQLVLKSDQQEISAPDIGKRDLQRCGASISQGTPAHGYLFFVTDKISLAEMSDLRPWRFRLICKDVFNRKHVRELTRSFQTISRPTEYARHGLTVTNKEADPADDRGVDGSPSGPD